MSNTTENDRDLREVTLPEMLLARENRALRQQELLARFHAPLICFTMNIAGPVKDAPLIRRGFRAGCDALEDALRGARLPLLFADRTQAVTGCEGWFAVDGDALAIKRLCCRIEDASPLGRLFDMDVLAPDGGKLERAAVGGGARNCIVCGAPGRACAARRLHSVAELQAATRGILETHFAEADARAVADLAHRALLDEARTTPKPGLVDLNNSGSHRDMDISTFEASAEALRSYWLQCFRVGQQTADQPPERAFADLRAAGLRAEKAMYSATGGVNTHKGAIFTMGVLCGAAGRLWNADAPRWPIEALLNTCAALTREAVARDFDAARAKPEAERTAGERLYLTCGLRGIRGELADGLPAVARVALPTFKSAPAAGLSRNDAGVAALLALIAAVADTNMLKRGGAARAREAAARAGALLERAPFPSIEEVEALDRWFIAENLSPGGCADLLAATYFIDALTRFPSR